jgi:hypothetical protein
VPEHSVVIAGIALTNSYAQNRKVGKPNSLKVLGASKPKGLNSIAKKGYQLITIC